jgi:uncharacterized protein
MTQSPENGQPVPEAQRNLSQVIIDLGSGGRDSWKVAGSISPQDFIELGAEATVATPGRIDISIDKEKSLWRIRGDMEVSVTIPCSRCLNNFTLALTVTVNRFFSVGQDPALSFGQIEMEEDVVYLETGEFSPLRFAEEEFILVLPMIPLCSETCLGLCQSCGADKNQEPCTCPTVEKENPFAILGKLNLD